MSEATIKRILITVKPSSGRLPLTVATACQLAKGLNAEVSLLSCLSDFQFVFAGAEPLESPTPLSDERESSEVKTNLEALAEPLRQAGLWVTTHLTTESPVHRAIVNEAAKSNADLLVAGIHEPGMLGPTQFTALDRQLMGRCPCPLLLVRNPEIASYRRILAAVDPLRPHGRTEGLDAAIVRTADELRKVLHAELWVANVHPDPESFELVSAVEVEPGIYYGAENIPAVHREAVDSLLRDSGTTVRDIVMRSGDPSTQILDLLGELGIDLVVLGALKRTALPDWLLGGTAERIAAGARCDVLLVKP